MNECEQRPHTIIKQKTGEMIIFFIFKSEQFNSRAMLHKDINKTIGKEFTWHVYMLQGLSWKIFKKSNFMGIELLSHKSSGREEGLWGISFLFVCCVLSGCR